MRLITYHPCSAESQEIRGLKLPGPPWAISTACCGRDLYLYLIENTLKLFKEIVAAFTKHLTKNINTLGGQNAALKR